MWPIEKPIDYPQNARKWSKFAISKVASSIKAFGWRQPIVVDSEGVIVIGHLRRAAGRSLGMAECPVHVAADLSPAKIRALRLADNRTNQEADWDMEMLATEFGELKALDFDLSLTGFDAKEWQIPDEERSLSSKSSIGDLQFRIVVGCQSEQHQAELLQRFGNEGLTCQALI